MLLLTLWELFLYSYFWSLSMDVHCTVLCMCVQVNTSICTQNFLGHFKNENWENPYSLPMQVTSHMAYRNAFHFCLCLFLLLKSECNLGRVQPAPRYSAQPCNRYWRNKWIPTPRGAISLQLYPLTQALRLPLRSGGADCLPLLN